MVVCLGKNPVLVAEVAEQANDSLSQFNCCLTATTPSPEDQNEPKDVGRIGIANQILRRHPDAELRVAPSHLASTSLRPTAMVGALGTLANFGP